MMRPDLCRRAALAASLSLAFLATACAVEGGYVVGSPGLSLDYYQPYGMFYGGWSPGYRVAPYRGGAHFVPNGRAGQHFHAAPPSRPMPSIPSHGRPGGGGGGARGGGGGGRGGGGHH